MPKKNNKQKNIDTETMAEEYLDSTFPKRKDKRRGEAMVLLALSALEERKKIKEKINELLVFFECDMWYAKQAEWKTEDKMIEYLRAHFNILDKEINGEMTNANANSTSNKKK